MNTPKPTKIEDIVPEMSKAKQLLQDQREILENVIAKIHSIADKCNNISPLSYNLPMDETRPDNLIEALEITNINLVYIDGALQDINEHLLKTIG